MQKFRPSWFATEHHRLHHVEQWPDSPRKRTVIEAIQSTLDSLARHPHAAQESFSCFLCEARKTKPKVIQMRPNREAVPILTGSTDFEKTA
jgi:hypothetical protein